MPMRHAVHGPACRRMRYFFGYSLHAWLQPTQHVALTTNNESYATSHTIRNQVVMVVVKSGSK